MTTAKIQALRDRLIAFAAKGETCPVSDEELSYLVRLLGSHITWCKWLAPE